MSRMRELEQKDFAMQIVEDLGMQYATKKSSKKQRFAIFICPICGKHFRRNVSIAMKTTECKTCKLQNDNPNYRHGKCKKDFTGASNYMRWANILTRCTNKNSKDYRNYGGRGIAVKFSNFKEFDEYVSSLNNANKNGYSVDRIDVNGNYEKCNLRWATYSEQCFNQRLRKSKTGVRGVAQTKYGTYKARVTIGKRKRIELGSFKTIEEAENAINKCIQITK